MGSIIKSTAIVTGNGFSAITNATQAGRDCLEQAGLDANDIGLLINAGVYRDNNIMEPSIASLIQKELNMGLDFRADAPHQATFSFDVVNGACGFLNAVAIADSFLRNATARYALIVCGDAHPSQTDHPEFPYVAVGAAALLSLSEDSSKGFQRFSYLSNDYDQLSHIGAYGDLEQFGDQGRGRGQFYFNNQYIEAFRHLNVELINRSLAEWDQPTIDFLLGSDLETGYCHSICDTSNLRRLTTRVMELHSHFNGDPHTAAHIAAFHQLQQEVPNPAGLSLLFSAVGSGDASACALYRT
ncbi:MAG: hypothetical protein D9N11_05185 [Ketobacter sp.]|nr:MAG: hypothetical protein D9N11_05185 [Ketobacter sp.]